MLKELPKPIGRWRMGKCV